MKSFFLSLLLLIFFSACNTKSKIVNDYYMPAEWEPQEAVWFGWEESDSSYYPVITSIIKSLLPTVQVKIAADSDSLITACKNILQKSGIDTSTLSYYIMKGERYWMRDHGAAFLVNDKGGLAVADFNWNLYGIEGWYNAYYNNQQDSVSKRLKKYLDKNTALVDSLMAVAEKAEIVKSDLFIEGGAFEVNGKGTLILCEAVALQRNPGKSKQQIETGFKKALGVSKIIWMKEGLIDDAHIQQIHFSKYMTMGTGGHTDEFVRFVNPSTILLAWVDEAESNIHPMNKVNYERMSENLRILQAATDQDGIPFKIIKVPLPGPIERQVIVKNMLDKDDNINVLPRFFIPRDAPKVGDTLINVAASSYLNYLVSNGVVILPTYISMGSSKEKENKIKEIFNSIFPNRKLVWIPCMPQNWDGGGIHCSTQQQPKRK